jgi:putative efflux protein, MATE family
MGQKMKETISDDQKRIKHYKKMTETPVGKLVTTLAIPTIISQLVTAVYNTADTFFVSHLALDAEGNYVFFRDGLGLTPVGTSAAGAVGIVFSVMAILQAIAFTIGQGGGAHMSKLLGEKRNEEANVMASSAFFTGILFGLVLLAFGLTFLSSVMRALGATKTILPYARDYGFFIFLAAPLTIASLIMNTMLRFEGKALFAMCGIATGGVLNLFLDPVFIYGFGMGTRGAAAATALSQSISFSILLSMYLRGKSNVRLNIRKVSGNAKLYLSIFKVGLPSLSRQGLASIATVALNVTAAGFGDAAVAAMSIANRCTFMVFSVNLGIGQGFQPVSSFNWGARRYDRVKGAVVFTAILSTATSSVLSAFGFVFARSIIGAFVSDPTVISIGSMALRAQCCVLPFTGVNTTCNMAHQTTLHSAKATFLALLRQGICFLPAILILPCLFGLDGVIYSQCVADGMTAFITVFFFASFLRELAVLENDRTIKPVE